MVPVPVYSPSTYPLLKVHGQPSMVSDADAGKVELRLLGIKRAYITRIIKELESIPSPTFSIAWNTCSHNKTGESKENFDSRIIRYIEENHGEGT